MMLQTVNCAYQAVNVAGYVNSTWLSSDALAQGVGTPPLPNFRYAHFRLPGRVVGAFDGALRHAFYNSQRTLSEILHVRRSFFFLKLPMLPVTALLGGLSQGLAYHPVADLLIGRGHDVGQTAPHYLAAIDETLADLYHRGTHYGVAGCILEALPLACSQWFADKGNNVLACACLCAAVAGRMLLQVPRLLVSAQAFFMDLALVGAFTGAVFILEMGIRALLGAIFWVLDMNEEGDEYPWPATEHTAGFATVLDRGGAGADQRVRDRLAVLTRRLEPLYDNESTTAEEIMATLEAIAADLRRYCSQLPDMTALRGGLALLRATAASLWTEEDGVVFRPPELSDAA